MIRYIYDPESLLQGHLPPGKIFSEMEEGP